MFEAYRPTGDLAALQAALEPTPLVLECERDFETLPTESVYELAMLTDDLAPLSVDPDWIPRDGPSHLQDLDDADPIIGLPGDGGVTWTRQTSPPAVLIKPRLAGAPTAFRDFLVAEALVQLREEVPETMLEFFGERYPALQTAANDDPDLAYRLGISLHDGWCGHVTRSTFAGWTDSFPDLHAAWVDAGDRVQPRLEELPGLLAAGEMGFGAATELACSAIKHDCALPAPFDALTVAAFRDHGPDFAVRWTERTLAELD